jgi:MATE family multidrug resistance protein
MTKMKAHEHPFVTRPHRTLLGLMFPVLLALAADPLTGLVDTAFVARLGTDALAGLGVAAVALGAMFWIFNFLNVGTQTQVSQAYGGGATAGVRRVVSLALMTGWGLGLLVMVAFYPLAGTSWPDGWVRKARCVRRQQCIYRFVC